MPDAFHTPDEARDEAIVVLHSAEKLLTKIEADFAKYWRTECLVLVLVSCSLMFGGTLVLEYSLKQQAKINQERNVAWIK